MYQDQQAPFLLRTYYSTNEAGSAAHDQLMKQWANSNMYEYESWWGALDDEEYPNFGSNWRRIYDILPE